MNLVFRLNAGIQYGMGHISRCIDLGNSFIPDANIFFIIKADDHYAVSSFIRNKTDILNEGNIRFINDDISREEDLAILIEYLGSTKSFLILDHYDIDEGYQKKLRENDIRWLQFDSHARVPLYGNIVLHASPGAQLCVYNKLAKNPNIKFLLGLKYIIVNDYFRQLRLRVKPRKQLSRIFISFGAGDDRSAAFFCLSTLYAAFKDRVCFFVSVGEKNPEVTNLSILAREKNINLFINDSEVADHMLEADLAIISPGTISYEAASLGLPMILISIADNQHINAAGWDNVGCAVNLGRFEEISASKIFTSLKQFIDDASLLEKMSRKALELVDGQGVYRIKQEVLNYFKSSL